MHLRIAVTAEPTDWLTAAHHYVEGGAPHEAMRVLSESTMRTLGTGAWGAAIELVDRMPRSNHPCRPGHPRPCPRRRRQTRRSVALLERLVRPDCTPIELSLVRVTRLNACFRLSQPDQVTATLTEIVNDPASPRNVLGIAEGYSLLLHAAAGGPLAPTKDGLVQTCDPADSGGPPSFRRHIAAQCGPYRPEHGGLSCRDCPCGDVPWVNSQRYRGLRRTAGSTRAIIALCAMELG